MTAVDRMDLLRKVVAETSQAEVARKLGYSAAAINQAIRGNYNGALDRLLERVVEVYGQEKVLCPVLGEIPLGKCAEERRKPFAATNPQRVRLFRACKECREKQ